MALRAKYRGSDDPAQDYINGVPARDLTDEDWALLSDQQKAEVGARPKLYSLRGEARDDAEKAERKVEREQRAAERAPHVEVRVEGKA